MKPTVEKKHVFGEKKPRLIRTKRILGELASAGESKWYRERRGDEIRSENRGIAESSGRFIRELGSRYEPGFVATTKTGKAEIQLESANHSARLPYLRDDAQYNQWQLTITTTPAKGNKNVTIIKGTPYWRHPEDYPGTVSGVSLVTVDPKTGKEHYYLYGEEESRLQSTVWLAFRHLMTADQEGTLETRPLEPEQAPAQEAA